MNIQESYSPETEADNVAEPVCMQGDVVETAKSSTKRSDVLRHVFPRPSHHEDPLKRESAPRITKPQHRKMTLSSFRQSRPKTALHRVLTSIFNHSPAGVTPDLATSLTDSCASSVRSRAGSIQGSYPSLEVIFPGTFLFSGPSLRSECSGSLNNSTSRLRSWTRSSSESPSLRRVQSESFSVDSMSFLEDGILEPLVTSGITRSMSDILLGVNTPFHELDGRIVEDLNEDDQTVGGEFPHYHYPGTASINTKLAALLLPYLDLAAWKALRLASRAWHGALSSIAPPIFPPCYHVPVEILQHIYGYLSPKDFNAARHTCRNWMRASLNKSLLMTMLRRAGWWKGAEADLEKQNRKANFGSTPFNTSDEWFLSRRISRECALSSGWTGNGLDKHGSCKAIVEIARTDFADMANGSSGVIGRHAADIVFSMSTCGQFLLVARETLIYVYELHDTALRPLTSVTCPRRVLSMSMDVSSGRHAVAALLEGRLGMVCELRFGRNTGFEIPMEVNVDTHTHPYRTTSEASIATSQAHEVESEINTANPMSSDTHQSYRTDADQQSWTSFSSVDVRATRDAITLQGTDDYRTHDQNWINHTWNLNLRGVPSAFRSTVDPTTADACVGNIPVETGTSTFYRHLCSEDDPPRSVSICPQRRCVAFGCSAGIELHWVDAMTAQGLSRWFPLTAPSDYLHFLPPPPGFQSAKKLRLISSAAHPNDRPAINRKFSSCRPTVGSFWGSFGFESQGNRPRALDCDHYRAIPLSDGHHVLFIDPPSGNLFLGCDAPLGGPTKLLRKVLLSPPKRDQVPRLYTAAADLTWGARIVVAFDDAIMLYSVPPDIFATSGLEHKAENWDVYVAPPFSSKHWTKDHWLDWLDEDLNCQRLIHSAMWPLAIRGIEIGTLIGVCELAIYTQPEITIWGFALNSQTKTWQLRNQARSVTPLQRYVCRSGLVHSSCSIDNSGMVTMEDADDLHTLMNDVKYANMERSVGLDGHSSEISIKRIPRALHVENDEWVELLDVRGCDAWYDMNGDVVMTEDSPVWDVGC